MQVCLNGHKITDHYNKYPERRQNACEECGADTLYRCSDCGTTLRGRLMDGWPTANGPEVPDHCRECGEPFQWTDKAEEFTEVESSIIDTELTERSIPEYEDGHYQSAVRTAFLILEERVRDRGGFSRDVHGADLMTDAFKPDEGALAFGETGGEEQGVMLLYRGAMQSLRNPASHRIIEDVDDNYARDVIHTVNLLLRLMELNNPAGSDSTHKE